MSKAEEALTRFGQGFSCSQAVFATYAPELGLDQPTALRIASGFGGGMGCMAKTCGAVTGAFLVLGLKYGPSNTDRDAKEAIYARVRQFAEQFKARNATLECRDLLGCDISTAEGLGHARESGLFKQKCPKFVQDACEILEELS